MAIPRYGTATGVEKAPSRTHPIKHHVQSQPINARAIVNRNGKMDKIHNESGVVAGFRLRWFPNPGSNDRIYGFSMTIACPELEAQREAPRSPLCEADRRVAQRFSGSNG